MPKTLRIILFGLFGAALLKFSAHASAADWPMFGHDPQRTGWAWEETVLTPEAASRFELKWRVQVKNASKFLHALTVPVVAADVATAQGLRTLVYVAGASNNIFALDAADGRLVWVRYFDSRVMPSGGGQYQGTFLCPNGITATPAIDRHVNTIYLVTMDGRFWGLDLATGKDKLAPVPWIAPFAKSWSLNIVDGIIYTTLSQGCGDGESGFYSIDVRNPRHPQERRLLFSSTDTAGIWGRGGAVVGENGRVYGQTADGPFDPTKGEFSNTVVAGSIPELDLLDYFVPKDWQQVSKADLDMGSNSPVWFRFQNYNLLLGGGKQAIAWLMDADSLGGGDHQTPLWSAHLGNDQRSMQERGFWGGFSTWLDEAGERWAALPLWGPLSRDAPKFPLTNGPNPHGSIMVFKVKLDATARKPVLDPVWVSGDLNLPDPVVVAKGVLFALSTGENANQETDRVVNTRPAVLYALDAKTGKVLFQSGDAMKTWVHFSGLAVADARVYAVDHDSWVYCFGPRDR